MIQIVFEMKKINFILAFNLLLFCTTYGQVVPKGMNYQAIARNKIGEVLSNRKITLRLYLFANENSLRVNHYEESHEVTTDQSGLFNLIVGDGKVILGQYGLVPWNNENIWMEVSIRDQGQSDFITLGSSKLMAVPYALHATRARKLVDADPGTISSFAPPEPGVISTEWSVLGNAKTDASGNLFRINSLGTSDFVDVIMITDNVERLRILPGGDIITKLNFEIGKNLNVIGSTGIQNNLTIGDSLIVKNNALFNTIGGSTINNGPFTVANLSPTYLSGTFIVEKATSFNTSLTVQGPTDLNSKLNVNKMSPTKLTGTLLVDKITNLNDALNVNNMSPTYLSGTLVVDKATNFNDSLTVENMKPTYLSGTLTVEKSTNLNDSLSVNNMSPTLLSGTLRVDKEANLKDNVLITDITQSLSPSSGALVIDGGLGLGGNLNVGGASNFAGPVAFSSPVKITDATQSVNTTSGALIVTGGVGIKKSMNIGGTAMFGLMTSITDTTQSVNPSTGALKVIGGAGIGKNLNVGGNTAIAGMTSITNITSSTTATSGALKVAGGTGIGLQLNVGGITNILNSTQSNNITSGALIVSGGVGLGLQLNVGGMTSIVNTTESNNQVSGALVVAGGVGIGLQLNVGGMTSILANNQSMNINTGALKVNGGVGIGKDMHVGQALNVTGKTTLNGNLNVTGPFTLSSSNSFIANFINSTDQHGIIVQIDNPSPSTSNNFMSFKNSTGTIVGRVEGENSTEYTNNPLYKKEIAILNARISMAELLVAQSVINVAMATAQLVAHSTSATLCLGFGGCVTAPIPSTTAAAVAGLALRIGLTIPIGIALDLANTKKSDFVSYSASHVGVTYESGNGDYAEWLPKLDIEESFIPGQIVGVRNGKITKDIHESDKVMVISTKPIVLGNMPDRAQKSAFEKVAFLGQVPVQVFGKVNKGDYILPSGHKDGLGRSVRPTDMKVEDYSNIVGVAWSAALLENYNMVNVGIGLNAGDISKVLVEQKSAFEKLEAEFNESNAMLAKMLPGFKEEALKNNIDSFNHPISSVAQQKAPISTSLTSIMEGSNLFQLTAEELSETIKYVEKSFEENGRSLHENQFWSQVKSDPTLLEQFNRNLKLMNNKGMQNQGEKLKPRQ